MPQGNEFCPFEKEFCPSSEFEVIEGTLVHEVDPRHRATDGVLIRAEGQKIIPVADFAFSPFEEGEK